MKSRLALLLAAAPLALALPGCSSEEKPKEAAAPAPAPAPAPSPPLTYEESIEASLTAKVKAVDVPTRILTLEGASGNRLTFFVDEEVKRLNEVKVGDDVKVQYRATLLAELRAPTVGESVNPVEVIETDSRAAKGAAPSRTRTTATKIVTTVAAVDVPNMLLTLKGPLGDLVVVRGRKQENLKKLRIGDTIVITYTESTALSLEKLAPR